MGKQDGDIDLSDAFRQREPGPLLKKYYAAVLAVLYLVIGGALGVELGFQLGKHECLKLMHYSGCEVPELIIEDYSRIPVFDPKTLKIALTNKSPIYTRPDK